MKLLTFEFTNERFDQMIASNAEAMGYQTSVPNKESFIADPETLKNPYTIPNPESAVDFVWRRIHEQLVDTAAAVKANKEAEAIRKGTMERVRAEMHEVV